LRAASRARAASTIFVQMILASPGARAGSRRACADTIFLDDRLHLGRDELVLVCDENLGSGTFTESTQVRPSRMSSPVVSTFAFFAISSFSM
jgi:hypothetical protein